MTFDETKVERDQGGKFSEKTGSVPEVSLVAASSPVKAKAVPKVKCQHCEERVPRDQTAIAQRKGGGNYRRAPRFYAATICLECAKRLVKNASEGHTLSARWSIRSLKDAVTHIERAAYTQA